jgi:MFS transporter, ACS family, DAL5 transporter family protein
MEARNLTRDPEKEDFDHVSDKAGRSPSHDAALRDDSTDADDFGFTPEEQRKIIAHVDRRLVITVGVLYCVSLMDRTNLSAAAIAGMREELNLLVNNRYVCLPRTRLQSSCPS